MMKQATYLLVSAALALLSSGCHGIFDGIYDEVEPDAAFSEGFNVADPASGRITLMLDATDYGQWAFIDLHALTVQRFAIPREAVSEADWDGRSGVTYQLVEGECYTRLSSVNTASQAMPEQWDFAIHHFDVMTNGGAAAITGAATIEEAAALDPATFSFTPDVWSDRQVIVDLREMIGFKIGYQNSMVNTVLSDWVRMDLSSPPPVFTPSGAVYLVRLADGSHAAMQLRSYISERGTKGYLTIDMIYPL